MANHLSRRAFLGQTGTMAALAVANPPLGASRIAPAPGPCGWVVRFF